MEINYQELQSKNKIPLLKITLFKKIKAQIKIKIHNKKINHYQK